MHKLGILVLSSFVVVSLLAFSPAQPSRADAAQATTSATPNGDCDLNLLLASIAKLKKTGDPDKDAAALKSIETTVTSYKAACAGLSFKGTSSQEIGPIDLPAGRYKVVATGSFTAQSVVDDSLCASSDENFFILSGDDTHSEATIDSKGCKLSIQISNVRGSWQIEFRLQEVVPTFEPTPVPTITPIPSATIDANAYDLSGATVYKAPNDVIEILVPQSWKTFVPTQPGRYDLYYGTDQNPTTVLQVYIGTPAELSATVGAMSTPPSTAKALLQTFRDAFQTQVSADAKFSDDAAVTIGKLNGTGFTFSVPDSAQQPGVNLEVRAAPLPDGKVVFTFAHSDPVNWIAAKPTIDKMLDSLVVKADAIPTATPSPTPIKLELTATALQKQVATVQAQIQTLTASTTQPVLATINAITLTLTPEPTP